MKIMTIEQRHEKYKRNNVPDTVTQKETTPIRFPIIHTGETYYGDDMPQLQENSIVHYFQGTVQDEKLNRFKLSKTIDGLHYIFSLGEFHNSYSLSFKTEEYEYAVTNLSKERQEELAKTVTGFIESISTQGNIHIDEINIAPAMQSYSSEEIEECMDAILKSPENTLSEEELRSRYKAFKVFDHYYELFKHEFHGEHYNLQSRAKARSRYFKAMFRKNLPNWEVQVENSTVDFILKRKSEKSPNYFGK